jgi:hypothetical protein
LVHRSVIWPMTGGSVIYQKAASLELQGICPGTPKSSTARPEAITIVDVLEVVRRQVASCYNFEVGHLPQVDTVLGVAGVHADYKFVVGEAQSAVEVLDLNLVGRHLGVLCGHYPIFGVCGFLYSNCNWGSIPMRTPAVAPSSDRHAS